MGLGGLGPQNIYQLFLWLPRGLLCFRYGIVDVAVAG